MRTVSEAPICKTGTALKIVAENTTIPVPKLLEHGCHPDGRRFLVTERIDGVTLDSLLRSGCLMQGEKKHTNGTPCKECTDKAYSNAITFIEGLVLPQLAKLKSRERGTDGFVMPPSWLAPSFAPWTNKRNWKTFPLHTAEYVFQHGDLAA